MAIRGCCGINAHGPGRGLQEQCKYPHPDHVNRWLLIVPPVAGPNEPRYPDTLPFSLTSPCMRSGGISLRSIDINLGLKALPQGEIMHADLEPTRRFLEKIQPSADLDHPPVIEADFAIVELLIELNV
jgi:hypothetical protein